MPMGADDMAALRQIKAMSCNVLSIAISSQKKQKALALRPSAAPTKAALATARTSIGPVATKLATNNYMWENDMWVDKGEHIWDCDVVSEEAESPCTADGQNCSSSKCCANEGSSCARKDEHWASCNQTCKHNHMWENEMWVDKGEHIWDCDLVSEEAESPCTADGQNCSSYKCCANEGFSSAQRVDWIHDRSTFFKSLVFDFSVAPQAAEWQRAEEPAP